MRRIMIITAVILALAVPAEAAAGRHNPPQGSPSMRERQELIGIALRYPAIGWLAGVISSICWEKGNVYGAKHGVISPLQAVPMHNQCAKEAMMYFEKGIY